VYNRILYLKNLKTIKNAWNKVREDKNMSKRILCVDTRKLGNLDHPFMKKVMSLEVWQDGHFLEVVKVADEKVAFKREGTTKKVTIIDSK
jgi:hypothetical protein